MGTLRGRFGGLKKTRLLDRASSGNEGRPIGQVRA